ncbi:DNA polymerase IV [Mycobacteroides franklinii]|uniref:DNA polymerase IV n=1 Tax=Mycobacteroides franklinii TaxID=948102 RepID=A0A4V3HUM0_9MYCO|nr:DNA polymerase IV [Mycobacteroides franklinii]ORA62233.1 DNA polymerase IV [Mycobacteroides franklinii]TDH18844.1 DNA polymerase IV [Mycobacteroides franklinii]TDZ46484.1 DNA polymerase IV [Mycobacteroides franklinii]TDZ47993.1 DNA polymerase IV [Mycobacteroides franklinii]TDZ60202.1 DNA polymerase IV [Mycobacteroides franklinii]
MTGRASILHADLDSFYASVEQRDEPALRGRPVIVGGGVVLAASYEAKHLGVRTAMGGRQALRLCPHAVVVPPRFDAYSAASKSVFEVFRDTTPLVEPLSIDEAFLDVSGLQRISGTPRDIAATLRIEVRRRTGLPITVGVARTKFLAKVASRQGKPDGLLVVEPHEELSFLRPLPVQALWGVGTVTAEKLRVYGIRTVADVADLGESTLASMVGRAMGHQLHCLAHNVDPRRVQGGRRRRSIGAQCALGRHRRTPGEIDVIATQLIERIARRMRDTGRSCRTVVLRLRFHDYTRATRSHTVSRPTTSTERLLAVARQLVEEAAPLIDEQGITLIGFSVSNFDPCGAAQLELPFADSEQHALVLDSTLDELRDRFGTRSVTRATLLHGGGHEEWGIPTFEDL